MRTALRLLLLPLVAAVLAACSARGGDPADASPVRTGEVVAKDNRFHPVSVEVPAGATVTWSFQDGPVPHDVTGDGWTSGDPRSRGTFRHTFDQPGTYTYRCTLHGGMDGRVVVTR